MNKIRAVMLWLIAASAAVLYGAMYMGRYSLPMSFDPTVTVQAIPRVLHVLLEHYAWLPSFLAGWAAGRRGALLGVLTVIGGAIAEPYFHDLWLPTAHFDDWDSDLVNLAQGVLAIACAVVSGIAGEYLSPWKPSSSKPVQPIARESTRSG